VIHQFFSGFPPGLPGRDYNSQRRGRFAFAPGQAPVRRSGWPGCFGEDLKRLSKNLKRCPYVLVVPAPFFFVRLFGPPRFSLPNFPSPEFFCPKSLGCKKSPHNWQKSAWIDNVESIRRHSDWGGVAHHAAATPRVGRHRWDKKPLPPPPDRQRVVDGRFATIFVGHFFEMTPSLPSTNGVPPMPMPPVLPTHEGMPRSRCGCLVPAAGRTKTKRNNTGNRPFSRFCISSWRTFFRVPNAVQSHLGPGALPATGVTADFRLRQTGRFAEDARTSDPTSPSGENWGGPWLTESRWARSVGLFQIQTSGRRSVQRRKLRHHSRSRRAQPRSRRRASRLFGKTNRGYITFTHLAARDLRNGCLKQTGSTRSSSGVRCGIVSLTLGLCVFELVARGVIRRRAFPRSRETVRSQRRPGDPPARNPMRTGRRRPWNDRHMIALIAQSQRP